MTRVISTSTSQAFIEAVKLEHVIYKADVYQRIFGISGQALDTFQDHKHCQLGHWYYEGQGLMMAALEPYRRLEQPHRQIHAAGLRALVAKSERRHEDCISALHEMESASNDMIMLLDDMAESYKQMILEQTAQSVGTQTTGEIEMF